jgi:peptidoglycan/LPS O-acetylase OafA/YrhL
MNQFEAAARINSGQAGSPMRGVRFEALDSWRGICALLVAMMHFPASGPLAESSFIRSAYLFVDYFFVLSGFVIAHGYSHRLTSALDFRRFAILRIGRIYPLHVAVLLAFVGFELMRLFVPALRGDGAAPFTDGNSLSELAISLALLNGVGADTQLAWNGPSWSISAEMWTYFLFGIAVMLLGRRHWIALVPAVLGGWAILAAWSPTYMDATWHLGLVRCVYGFSLGALLYRFAGARLVARRKSGLHDDRHPLAWTLIEVAAILMVGAFVSLAGHGPLGLIAPFVFVLALWIFAREGGFVSRLLRTGMFLWLGALSYGIYMVHIFVQSRMINAATLFEKLSGMDMVGAFDIHGEAFYGFGMQGAFFGTLMMGAMIVAVVAAALVGHLVVEKPFQRLSRKLADRISERSQARLAYKARLDRAVTAGRAAG